MGAGGRRIMAKKLEAPVKEHSRLSPSGSKIWLNCTKAPELIAKYPEVEAENEYAEEGTQAHWYGELILKGKMTLEELPSDFSQLKTYIDKVHEIQADGNLLVEVKTNMTKILNSPEEISGTSDAVILAKDGGIDIVDLKWGIGVWVSAVENSQAMLYAIGVLSFLDELGLIDLETMPTNTRVTSHVVQPRVEYMEYTFHEITYGELLQFLEVARQAVKEISTGKGSFLPGEHCQFCKGKVFCPFFTEPAEEVNATVADFNPKLPMVNEDITPEKLMQMYKIKADVNAFYRALDTWLESSILSSETGEFMGYKIIETEGNREVQDEDALIKQLTEAGIDIKEIKQDNVVGFRILDQLASKAGIRKDDLAGVGKKITKKVVPATDYRDLLFTKDDKK